MSSAARHGMARGREPAFTLGPTRSEVGLRLDEAGDDRYVVHSISSPCREAVRTMYASGVRTVPAFCGLDRACGHQPNRRALAPGGADRGEYEPG
jgi:hypothetical protein